MFTNYFGLTRNPFDLANDAPFLSYDAEKRDICQQMLEDLLDGFSPIILTGEPGSGKTQLLRRLSVLLPPEILIITPINSCLNYAERVQITIDSFNKQYLETVKLLMVADNAQDIADADLSTLLTMQQHGVDVAKSFQMIWCGTPDLKAKLENINPTKFSDLYPNYYHLDGLDTTQVRHYLNDCLKRAGYSPEVQGGLFSPAAVDEIAQLSKGLPGSINQLCSTSLMLASLDHQNQVNVSLVREVAQFYSSSAHKAGGIAAHRPAKRSEDILRIMPEKLTISGLCKNLTRLFRFHWQSPLRRRPRSKSKSATETLSITQRLSSFFSRRDAKFFVGGILASGLCFMLLQNILNVGKQNPQTIDVSETSTGIETLPATSAGKVNAQSEQAKTVINASTLTRENASTEVTASVDTTGAKENYKPSSPNQFSSAGLVAPNVDDNSQSKPGAEKQMPGTPASIATEVSKQPESASLTTVQAVKSMNDKKQLKVLSATQSNTNKPSFTDHPSVRLPVSSLINTHKISRQEKPAVSTLHKTLPKQNQAPKFSLKPLDAPGNWDEIVIVDDPKTLQSNKDKVSEQISPIITGEEQAKSARHKAESKHKAKPKFVLKPLDAPGDWDEIVIVNDPKELNNKTGESSK